MPYRSFVNNASQIATIAYGIAIFTAKGEFQCRAQKSRCAGAVVLHAAQAEAG